MMKNNENRKKFNLLDVIILFALIGLVAIFALRAGVFPGGSKLNNEKNIIRITFYQEEVNSFTANNIEIGDFTAETLQNKSFGNVVEFEINPSVSWGEDENGNQVKSTKDNWSSVYIITETNGKVGPNGILIGNVKYYIGQTITFRVGDSIFFGAITDAEEL